MVILKSHLLASSEKPLFSFHCRHSSHEILPQQSTLEADKYQTKPTTFFYQFHVYEHLTFIGVTTF